jgi:hypothetical protein
MPDAVFDWINRQASCGPVPPWVMIRRGLEGAMAPNHSTDPLVGMALIRPWCASSAGDNLLAENRHCPGAIHESSPEPGD